MARKIFEENKHNGLVSDKIARDRSLHDTRPKECQTKQYLAQLPSVSVIIPFHNEILSTLTRTIHSVFTRSQPELLKGEFHFLSLQIDNTLNLLRGYSCK